MENPMDLGFFLRYFLLTPLTVPTYTPVTIYFRADVLSDAKKQLVKLSQKDKVLRFY